MRHIILIFLLILSPINVLFSSNADKEIFHAEIGGVTLPMEVEAVLKENNPVIARECGFLGKQIFLSDAPSTTQYYAVAPGPRGGCFGSGATTLLIVYVKDKKAKILIDDGGYYIIQLDKVSYGLHDLKFIGGGTHHSIVRVWSYNGSKYQRISNKLFVTEDCADSTKSKDPDFPWLCENDSV